MIFILQACWFIQHVCDVKINNESIWKDLTGMCSNTLLTDKELPVKVQAGLAIQALLIAERGVEPLLTAQVCFIFKLEYQVFNIFFFYRLKILC